MKIGRKLKVLQDRILNQKGREVFKMSKKITILSEIFVISGSFDEEPLKMGKKRPSTHEQKGCHMKTIEQLKIHFH